MTQRELVRQVARRTGESMKTIRLRGFSRCRVNRLRKERNPRSTAKK
jgi:hypothetical protein